MKTTTSEAVAPVGAGPAAAAALGALNPLATLSTAQQVVGAVKQFMPPASMALKPLEQAGRWLGSTTHAALDSRAQSGVDAANDVLAALGLQLWICTPSTQNARLRVRVRSEGRPEAGVTGVSDGAEPRGITPEEFVQFMRNSPASGPFGDGLRAYLQRLEVEGRLQPVPLPYLLQWRLYFDISRVVVFAFQRTLLTLDGASLWGHSLRVTSTQGPQGERRVRTSKVGNAQLQVVMDSILASQAVHIPMVPRPLERKLFTNCVIVVLQLIDELLAREGVDFLGHKLLFHLEPEPVDIVRRLLEENPIGHCQINEAAVAELVEELLADSETNIQWMPDVIERQIYQTVMRLMIRIAEHVVGHLRLTLLGREIKMSILSRLDLRAQQERISQQEAKEAVIYFEEQTPLRTVSTTELEEQLRDLEEQRRVLQALQELGETCFDLTAETPMQQSSRATAPETGRSGTLAVGEVPDHASEVHEFQNLAHALKLGRSLSVRCEVDADIEVPHGMIADLETYPEWMPWCTSGMVASRAEPVPGEEDAIAFDGKVGFGFETGTFLGTLGDDVHYRMTVRTPAVCSEGAEKRAGVRADAVNGFTYGKRLVYDWRFTQVVPKRTRVELNILFQARSVIYMPVWDSLQSMVVNNLLSAFVARAEAKGAREGVGAAAAPEAERLLVGQNAAQPPAPAPG